MFVCKINTWESYDWSSRTGCRHGMGKCGCLWLMRIWGVEEENPGAYITWPWSMGMVKSSLALWNSLENVAHRKNMTRTSCGGVVMVVVAKVWGSLPGKASESTSWPCSIKLEQRELTRGIQWSTCVTGAKPRHDGMTVAGKVKCRRPDKASPQS